MGGFRKGWEGFKEGGRDSEKKWEGFKEGERDSEKDGRDSKKEEGIQKRMGVI